MPRCIPFANTAVKQAASLALAAALGVFTAVQARAGDAPIMHVEKTATCGCCHAWVERMSAAGFEVRARDVTQDALTQMKIAMGITPETSSCHTAAIGGYVVEGHVPAADIRRLLAEAPAARGISVPGMPMGSPGMDFNDEREPYEVVLIGEDGALSTFSRHE
jgi:hypothetical protein